jgi:hypothetical protein
VIARNADRGLSLWQDFLRKSSEGERFSLDEPFNN